MKKLLNNLLTSDEQRVISFLLGLALLGMLIHYTGILSGISKDENKDTPVYDEKYEIKMNLSTVTFEDLVMIPGIGEQKAEDIISYREEHGFSSISDLIFIKGIGKKTLANIEDYFYLKEDSTLTLKKSVLEIGEPADSSKININCATLEELTELKGIGVKKAALILELRKNLGQFTDVDQLLEVKGIGEKTLNNIKGQVTLTDSDFRKNGGNK